MKKITLITGSLVRFSGKFRALCIFWSYVSSLHSRGSFHWTENSEESENYAAFREVNLNFAARLGVAKWLPHFKLIHNDEFSITKNHHFFRRRAVVMFMKLSIIKYFTFFYNVRNTIQFTRCAMIIVSKTPWSAKISSLIFYLS